MRCLTWSVAVALALLATPTLSWALTVDEQVRLGKRVMEEVRSMGLTDDASLDTIGDRLKGVVQRKDFPWRFWVWQMPPRRGRTI